VNWKSAGAILGSILLIALVGGIWVLFFKVSSARGAGGQKSQRLQSNTVSPDAVAKSVMKTPFGQALRSTLAPTVHSLPPEEESIGNISQSKPSGRLWSQELGTQLSGSAGLNRREAWQDAGTSIFAEHYHQLKPELIGAQASAL
jgi:hypothetical protein